MRLYPHLLISALSCVSLLACERPTAVAPEGEGSEPVTFELTISQESFLEGEAVSLTILDEEQLERREPSRNCTVSMGPNGEETTCPDGKPPPRDTSEPETISIPYADLAKSVSITSRTVTVGERFEISVGGKAADNCNSAGGGGNGTAKSAMVSLDLQVASTAMACEPSSDE